MPSRPAPKFEVTVDGRHQPYISPVQIHQSTMGSADWATFVVEGSDSRGHSFIDGVSLIQMFQQKEIEIRIVVGAWSKTIHWGKIVGGTVQYDGDRVTFQSRLDSHLFGEPFDRAWEAIYPRTGAISSGIATAAVDREKVIVNPTIDGKTRPNMWTMSRSSPFNVFIFADSVPAGAFSTPTPDPFIPEISHWTLTDLVQYLCNSLNPSVPGRYVQTPSRRTIQAVFGTDTTLLRDLELQRGRYLPELLDLVIEPFGFYWYVHYFRKGKRGIVFARRGNPSLNVFLPRQEYGSNVDPAKSYVHDMDITVDHIERACNRVTVLGAFEEREVTVELAPAWDPKYDEYLSHQLTTDNDLFLVEPELYDVHRKWILNEGGDYVKVRPKKTGPTGIPVPFYKQLHTPFPIWDIFGHLEFAIRRRKFHPTLTQSNDKPGTPFGQWNGVYVEYWDPHDKAWISVSRLGAEGTVQILETECGIRFSNPSAPPNTLMQIEFKDLKIRVTAVIRSDRRVRGLASRRVSNIKDTRTVVIDKKDQYRWASLQSDGDYKSRFYDSVTLSTLSMTALEIDDRLEIQRLTNVMLDAWNQSSIEGPIRLHGIDYHANYLGKTVREIAGSGVTFDAAPIPRRSYASISSVLFDVERQETVLTVSTHKRSKFAERDAAARRRVADAAAYAEAGLRTVRWLEMLGGES